MHFHTPFMGALAVIPQVLASLPLYHADLETLTRNNEPELQVETMFQFPNNGSWVDNIALRSDGSLLLTRLDVPEVWSVNTTSGNATLAYAFPNVTSRFGISEIDTDVFAVVVGNFSTETYVPTAGSFSLQKLDFNKANFKD